MAAASTTTTWLPGFFRSSLIQQVVILAFAFFLYANTLSHQFTQDDAIVIYENIYVKEGIKGLGKIFTTDSFSGFFGGEDKSDLVSGGRYRPLTIGVFAVLHEFVGTSTFVFHLFNVLMYGLVGLILYRLILLCHTSWSKEKTIAFAFIAAMIFVVHPIHTEAVANVKGLDEIFSLGFSLLALICSLKYLKSTKVIYLAGIALCFFAALLSKENAAAFVVIIPIVIYFFVKNASFRTVFAPTAILISMFVGYWILRTSIIGAEFGASSAEMMNNPFLKIEGNRYVPFTFEERWSSILYGLGKYIQLLFFPHPLTHDYYPRHFGVVSLKDYSVWMAIIMNSALVIIAILGIRRRSFVTFCIILFYATIGLMSNILFPIGTHLSERFLFTPSIAIALCAAYLMIHLLQRKSTKKYVSGFLVFLLLLGSIKTISRNQVWKDDFTLFTTDVEISKNSAKVRNAAGGALLTKSSEITDEPLKNTMISKAIEHLNVATSIHPNYKESYLLLGNAYSYIKDYDQSIGSYENALRINPYFDEASGNLMIVLIEGARFEGGTKGNFTKAIAYLEKALQKEPQNFQALSLMGTAYGSAGDHWKAIEYFEKAIDINSNIATTYVNLGFAQLNAGLEEDAQINFQKAIEIDPNSINQIENGK